VTAQVPSVEAAVTAWRYTSYVQRIQQVIRHGARVRELTYEKKQQLFWNLLVERCFVTHNDRQLATALPQRHEVPTHSCSRCSPILFGQKFSVMCSNAFLVATLPEFFTNCLRLLRLLSSVIR